MSIPSSCSASVNSRIQWSAYERSSRFHGSGTRASGMPMYCAKAASTPAGTLRRRSSSSHECRATTSWPRARSASATRCVVKTSRRLPMWIGPEGEIPDAHTTRAPGAMRSSTSSASRSPQTAAGVVSRSALTGVGDRGSRVGLSVVAAPGLELSRKAGNVRRPTRVVHAPANPAGTSRGQEHEMNGLRVGVVALSLLAPVAQAQAARHDGRSVHGVTLRFEQRSLDGARNNRAHPWWGQAGTASPRIAPARYADGVGAQAAGPSPRYVSNRVFSDLGQNLFSERGVTQWVWTWGQFIDHTFGLAKDGDERAPMGLHANDPLEAFRNDLGALSFTRDGAAAGTGPRQQTNTVSSYIDGWPVYRGPAERPAWW